MDKHTIRLQKAREYYYENKDKYKERYLEKRKSSRPASSGSESETQGKHSSKKVWLPKQTLSMILTLLSYLMIKYYFNLNLMSLYLLFKSLIDS